MAFLKSIDLASRVLPRQEVSASLPQQPAVETRIPTSSAWSGGSSFTASLPNRGPNLTGFAPPPLFFGGPQQGGDPSWPGPLTPLEPTESGAIALGTVSHRDGSRYSIEVAPVLTGENPDLTYCASTAFEGLALSDPEWGNEDGIQAVLTRHGKASSVEVWNQLSEQLDSTVREELVPPDLQVATHIFDADSAPTITLTDADGGNPLSFTVEEVQTRNDTGTPTSERAYPAFTSLGEMEVGEVRAVCTRPLQTDLTPATTITGHWVLVERTGEDSYRIVQSAPETWALLGVSGGTPEGGEYVQEFSGPDALQDASNYLHAEAQYMIPGASGRYAIMVLDPEASAGQ